jgi:hypothetical protein
MSINFDTRKGDQQINVYPIKSQPPPGKRSATPHKINFRCTNCFSISSSYLDSNPQTTYYSSFGVPSFRHDVKHNMPAYRYQGTVLSEKNPLLESGSKMFTGDRRCHLTTTTLKQSLSRELSFDTTIRYVFSLYYSSPP